MSNSCDACGQGRIDSPIRSSSSPWSACRKRAASPARRPRLMAAMTAAFAVGQVIGPLAVSFLVGAVGGFGGTRLFASAVLVAGALLLVRPR